MVSQVLEQRLTRFTTENIHGQLYCDVLETELKRSMAKFLKKTKIVYQQDLAPWHTSNIVKDKITKLKVNVLDWAPKSPDLNPIEMYCGQFWTKS